MRDNYLSLEQKLEIANQKQLQLAAEAVVDAAIWRYSLKSTTLGGRVEISEGSRRSLINLINQEPTLTPYLFTDELWEKH